MNMELSSIGIDSNLMSNEIEERVTKEDFSFYLKNMREFLGMSKKDFAESLKIPQTSYYTYEKGKTLPSNWERIQERIQLLVKKKSTKIQNKEEFYSCLNPPLEEKILGLHYEGKNIVQISLKLSLDEKLIEDFLLSRELTPIYFKMYD